MSSLQWADRPFYLQKIIIDAFLLLTFRKPTKNKGF